MVITASFLIIPDLLEGGGRSLKSRYLVPAFLPITLSTAYFFANSLQFSKHHWEKLVSGAMLSILLMFGVISGGEILKNPGWDYLDQGQTASVVNLEIAPIINKSSRPLIISDATHSFLLALSHEVKDETQFQLLQDAPFNQWSEFVDIPQALKDYSDVFIYFPSQELLTFLDQVSPGKLLPLLKTSLYRIAP